MITLLASDVDRGSDRDPLTVTLLATHEVSTARRVDGGTGGSGVTFPPVWVGRRRHPHRGDSTERLEGLGSGGPPSRVKNDTDPDRLTRLSVRTRLTTLVRCDGSPGCHPSPPTYLKSVSSSDFTGHYPSGGSQRVGPTQDWWSGLETMDRG